RRGRDDRARTRRGQELEGARRSVSRRRAGGTRGAGSAESAPAALARGWCAQATEGQQDERAAVPPERGLWHGPSSDRGFGADPGRDRGRPVGGREETGRLSLNR